MSKIVGVFEDEYGIPVTDPGRMIFIPNISPAPPTPLIPTGLPQPPGELKFLSIATPSYVNKLSYSSGISIVITYTFFGYKLSADYLFKCGNTTNSIKLPSLFGKDKIWWYDIDATVKNTPKDPSLMDISNANGTPLVTGNHADNPHIDGSDIIVKLENGKKFVIRGVACAEKNKIASVSKAMDDMLKTGAQCYYAKGDVNGFNSKK